MYKGHKFIKMCLFLVIALTSYIGYAAQVDVTPEIYKVTINKIEFHNSTTDTWITVGQGDMTFDIASVNAGATVGGYVSGKPIPAGTYDKVRITVSRHMSIKIHASYGGTDYYTTSSSMDVNAIGVRAVVASTNSSDYAEGEVVSPDTSNGIHYEVTGDYFTDTQTFSSPVTIQKGSSGKLKVAFDVTNCCSLYTGDNNPPWGTTPFFYPGAPTVSASFE